jgi:hypothetical protein
MVGREKQQKNDRNWGERLIFFFNFCTTLDFLDAQAMKSCFY